MIADGERSELEGRTRRWSRIRRYAPLIVWMGFIFFASTGEFSASNTSRIIGPLLRWLFPDISEENLLLAHYITRKVAHFTEYAILAWLAARVFTTSSRQTLRRQWFLISFLLVVVYSLSDEYHQSFVASRTGTIYDSFIDMSGGLAALIIYALWRRRAERKDDGRKPGDST
jgi:VanZ family protein